MNLHDIILAKDDLKKESVYLKPWDITVTVRELNVEERSWVLEILQQFKNDTKAIKEFDAKIAIKCVLDEDGKQVFTEKDLPALLKKSSEAISTILDVVWRLSGFEKAKKNSRKKKEQSTA